ncbi:multiprotein-bridging factor 1 family protein [Streptomyces sp. NPDC059247]|uniref:helix-turn-helix domain-containing protein n=1 Tax=Streptomyces sp. NPDC059247 TaxID=3346790 RepID=UPI00368BDF67
MGRPENPVDFSIPARGRLAVLLRDARYSAGLTYDQLAEMTGRSPATLKRASSGASVPEEKVVIDIIQACSNGERVTEARRAWKRARMADRGRYDRDIGHTRPDLRCSDRRELAIGLSNVYEYAGAPTLDALVARAGGSWALPRSSAAAIIRRKMLPVSMNQLVAYLKGCDVPARVHSQWIYVWLLHGGRGNQRSTKAGRPSVTQNLTADLAHIIQTGVVDSERMDAIFRNLVALLPESGLVVSTSMTGYGVSRGHLRRLRRQDHHPWLGMIVVDETGRRGVLCAVGNDPTASLSSSPLAWLRPVGGGKEWTTDPASLTLLRDVP